MGVGKRFAFPFIRPIKYELSTEKTPICTPRGAVNSPRPHRLRLIQKTIVRKPALG